MGTVIQDRPQRHHRRQPRWDRFERADLFASYRTLRTQGLSEHQAATELQVPRTTLQAWRLWHATLDTCPHAAAFFQSGPGLAFLHRLVMALHLACVAGGAGGIRLACLFLNLTGLDRFVAASYGAQQHVNCQGGTRHRGLSPQRDRTRAQDMPHQDLTVTQDDTCPGGLCLLTMDPESNGILLAQVAQAREQHTGDDLMAPTLAPRTCRVIQSTSDAAPGLLASVAHDLEAHHAPDVFHGQHELVKAVSGPLATKERAAHKAVTEAQEQRERLQTDPQNAGGEPAQPRRERTPKAPTSLEHAEHACEAASREHARLAEQRAQVKAHIRGIGHDYHFVDLERGVRRNGPLIAADIHACTPSVSRRQRSPRRIAFSLRRSEWGLRSEESRTTLLLFLSTTSPCPPFCVYSSTTPCARSSGVSAARHASRSPRRVQIDRPS